MIEGNDGVPEKRKSLGARDIVQQGFTLNMELFSNKTRITHESIRLLYFFLQKSPEARLLSLIWLDYKTIPE
jgi:hypothetical protein